MNLEEALLQATKDCSHDIEEEGGIILSKDNEFVFHKLRNQNTGTPIAPVLWTADRNEYATIVLPKFKDGWRHYASFHTHPQFQPFPSQIDLTQLFPGFPINFIFSKTFDVVTEWATDAQHKTSPSDSYLVFDTCVKSMKKESVRS